MYPRTPDTLDSGANSNPVKEQPLVVTLAYYGLVMAFVVAIVGMLIGQQKFNRAGVPNNHIVVEKGGRYFYQPRGLREPQVEISREQYEAWHASDRLLGVLGVAGVLVFLSSVSVVVWFHVATRLATKPRHDAARPTSSAPGR